jgi:hypothetical protein
MSNRTITQWNLVEVINKAALTDNTVVFLSNDPNAYTVQGDALVSDGQSFPLDQFNDTMERGDGRFAYAAFCDGVVDSLVAQEDALPNLNAISNAA